MDARLTQTEINRASYNAVCREWADYRAKSRIGECIAEFERRLTENSDILDIALKDQIIQRPEDMNCSQIKVENFKGDIVSVDLSKIGSVKCVNYND